VRVDNHALYATRDSQIKEMITYRIYDNYDVPFLVDVADNNDFVTIYKVYRDMNAPRLRFGESNKELSKKHFMTIKLPDVVFIGKSVGSGVCCEYGLYWNGNSILVQPNDSKREYIFIGMVITKFKTDTPIQAFYSPVGNNVVPYPFALSNDCIYLFSEDKVIKKCDVPKKIWQECMSGALDPYSTLLYNADVDIPSDTFEYEILPDRWTQDPDDTEDEEESD